MSSRWNPWIGLAVLLLGPAGARAQAVPADEGRALTLEADEADVQFRLGNAAYGKKDFRLALSHYFASNRMAPNRNVVFNIARCFEALGQHVEAHRYYQVFARGQLGPAERKAVGEALARVRPLVALLRIDSRPAGATIYLNRRELGSYGQTPAELAVAPGRYRVILEREGRRPFESDEIALEAGREASLRGDLERILGDLRVRGEPAGAVVRVEDPAGPVVAALPVELQVSPGRLKVSVTRDGYEPAEHRVLVEEGREAELEVRLQPQTGSLVVQCDEAGALILLDGQPAGFTPAVLDRVPVGSHQLSIQQAGFHPFRIEVEVQPDARQVVDARLTIVEDVAAASRLQESARDAPASVSLVSRRELDAFGFATAADAVAGLRGAYASDDGTYRSLGLRGYSPFGQYGNRLLVLLDGHALNDDWIGSSYVGFDLLTDLESVERIELVRGPGSALYGTGAFFGVLNLVSPSGVREERLRAGLGLVGPGMLRGHALGSAPLGEEAGFWLAAGGLYGQGQDVFSPARLGSAEAPDGLARGMGEVLAASALGRVYWRDLSLQFYHHVREKQIPTAAFGTVFGDRRSHSDDSRSYVELRYEPRFGDVFQLLGRLSYDHYSFDGVFAYADPDTGLSRETYRGDWSTLELRGVLTPGAGLRLTLGGLYEHHFANPGVGTYEASGETYFRELHPYQAFAGYLVVDYAPLDWLSLSAGARFDGWSISALPDPVDPAGPRADRFLYAINPRAAIILKPTGEDTLKLMGGGAFRAPSVYELTYWDGGLTQVPSPGLEPERIYTGEVEYTRRLPAGFWLTAAVYLNHLTDLIVQVGSGDAADPLRYENQADALWTLGGELELRREFRGGLLLAAQYSYQRTRAGDLIDGQEPPNSPAHLFGARAVLPLVGRTLQLATRLLVEAGRLTRAGGRTDPAVLWDATLSGQVEGLGLRYALGARNLLDWRIEHPVGEDILDVTQRQPGLGLFLDLSFSY
jgi:outer membrane receptor protein involved in Fe transport